MRSISAQNVTELGGRSSILARQKRDHVKLDGLLQRLSEVPANGHGAVRWTSIASFFPMRLQKRRCSGR
jgi:hypothetical protein